MDARPVLERVRDEAHFEQVDVFEQAAALRSLAGQRAVTPRAVAEA